ncbi:MAG: response regulator [Rickettsiales bacterium]
MAKCLIIAADEYIRDSVADMTEGCGFECRTAENSIHGLIACSERMPDVIIINCMLPDMNGIEFFEILRGMPGGRRPFVILCSDIQMRSGKGAAKYLESLRDSVVRAAFA